MKSNELFWHDYLQDLIEKKAEHPWLPEEVAKRLKVWQKRFEMYSDVQDKAFKDVKDWQKKSTLAHEGEKLRRALIALQELDTANLDKTKEATKKIINVQLMKLEIMQLRLLGKAQNLTRKLDGKFISDMEKELKALRQKAHASIANQPERFSATIKNSGNESKFNNAATFFKSYERRISFAKHYRRADKTADTINMFGSVNSLISHTAAVTSAFFMSTWSVLSSILHAIPFINAIVSAIPILIEAVKTWARHKSTTKKAFAGILIGIIIGGLITTGLATVAAAGVAIALMGIGTYVKHIHPWAKYSYRIYKKKKEIAELDKTIPEFKELAIEELKSSKLKFREQQFLMVKLEEAWIKGEVTKDQLNITKNLILAGEFAKLNSDPDISKLTEGKPLQEFLVEQMQQRQLDLGKEIEALSVREKRKRINVALGVTSIIGAILLCIPTPPTIIIGASLLTISAVINVWLAFDLGTKTKNLFSKIYNKYKSAGAPEESENLLNHLKPVMRRKESSTLTEFETLHMTHAPKYPIVPEEMPSTATPKPSEENKTENPIHTPNPTSTPNHNAH